MYNDLMKSCLNCGRGNLHTDAVCFACGEEFPPTPPIRHYPRVVPLAVLLAAIGLLCGVLILRPIEPAPTENRAEKGVQAGVAERRVRIDPLQNTQQPVSAMRQAAAMGEWKLWGDPIAAGRSRAGKRLVYQGTDGRLIVDVEAGGKVVVR